MNKVVLTADSGICANRKNNTIIIPAQIVVNGEKSFSDDGTITNRQILDDMKQGIVYKTASPLLGDFEKIFRNELEQGKDVIHLSMGSGISEGSVNGANVIASELNNEYNSKEFDASEFPGVDIKEIKSIYLNDEERYSSELTIVLNLKQYDHKTVSNSLRLLEKNPIIKEVLAITRPSYEISNDTYKSTYSTNQTSIYSYFE